METLKRALVTTTAFLASCAPQPPDPRPLPPNSFAFAVFGDGPYTFREHGRFARVQLLLIHGDSHEYTLDHPLKRPSSDQVLENFTRLETFGSPEIGWVKVVIDSVPGRVVEVEPRLMRRGLLW